MLIDLRKYTLLSIYFVFWLWIKSHCNFYMFFLIIVIFDSTQITVLCLNPSLLKGNVMLFPWSWGRKNKWDSVSAYGLPILIKTFRAL